MGGAKNEMDRYAEIKKNLLHYAESDEEIKAVVAIGSSTRDTVLADEFSDLDLIIATTDPDKWFSGEYPRLFGNVSISFIEPTLGGGKERRSIYDEDKDVDMIIFTPEQFESAIKEGVAGWVMNRGYAILYDSDHFTELIKQYVKMEISHPDMTEEEFLNLVNDFYFHNIWACKKLLRGELWSAKMSVGAYLKNHLLKMIELYCYRINGTDVWHDGRFIDRWADDFILRELKICFAHYDTEDVKAALMHTHQLFAKLARAVAEILDYEYPEQAEKCAEAFLREQM